VGSSREFGERVRNEDGDFLIFGMKGIIPGFLFICLEVD